MAVQKKQPVLKTSDLRLFIQTEGPSPANPFYYYGCTSLGELSQDQGEPEPIYCPDPAQRGRWVIVDTLQSVPGLGSTSFTHRGGVEMRDAFWDIVKRGCDFTMQIVAGKCGRPDNFEQWEGKLLIRGNRITSLTVPGANPLTGDDNAAFEITGDVSFMDMSPIHALVFGEKADATVLAEIIDGVFLDDANCGDCGAPSPGCVKQYWLASANAGSPGLSAQLVYSIDGDVFETSDIATLAGTSGAALVLVGNFLVVLDTDGEAHHMIRITDLEDGVASWAMSGTGYVADHGPIAAWSKSPSRTFIVGEGGYVYLLPSATRGVSVLSDGSATTQDLNAIDGNESVVVAVGASNSVIVSRNDGRTFALVVGPEPGVDLSAVGVVTDNVWWVGTATGNLHYTLNGGKTWTEYVLGSDVTSINDIQFVDEVVGYLAVTTSSGGRVYRTTTSGNLWSSEEPDLSSLPDNTVINVVAACGYNTVGAGGVVSGGDGLIAVAK